MAPAWTPLESNPEVLTDYIRKLGVEKAYVTDVLGFDSELLALLPEPVKSLILLFPCSDAYERHRGLEDEELKKSPPKLPDNLFYMKQIVQNACGTIALVHAILNNTKSIDLKEDGVIKNFYEKAKDLSPEERGKVLEADEDFTKIHQSLAQEGQTSPPDPEVSVNYHFVALTNVDGHLMELDGRKNFPVNHGETKPEDFLTKAGHVCKQFMARDPQDLRFTVLALIA